MAALPERRRTEWLWREGRNEMIPPDEYLQGAEVYEVQVSVVIVTLVCTGGLDYRESQTAREKDIWARV